MEINLRNAYLLTQDVESDRAQFSRKILINIGFNVIFIKALKHIDKVKSNKYSMQYIYKEILKKNNNYSYVFEDDINILEQITIDEIIEYEQYSPKLFYLGVCKYNNNEGITKLNIKINNNIVYSVNNYVRGLHGLGISLSGAKEIIKLSEETDLPYMDMIIENYIRLNPAIIVRYDLESYIYGHRGILFQDRKRFMSKIKLSPSDKIPGKMGKHIL